MSSPGLTDKMSPLTPDGAQKSPVCEGNVSPLTPPPRPLPSEFDIHEPPPPGLEVVEEQVVEERPYSPKTPPLPPPNILPPPPPPQLEMDDSMSPVSDTEFANISPPAESPETPKSSDNNIIPSPPPMTPPSLTALPASAAASVGGAPSVTNHVAHHLQPGFTVALPAALRKKRRTKIGTFGYFRRGSSGVVGRKRRRGRTRKSARENFSGNRGRRQ